MVTFRLAEEHEDRLLYFYFPEGNETLRPGKILVDRTTSEAEITQIAEGDRERIIPAQERNAMADSINQTVHERGGTDFVSTTDQDVRSVYYGDHAVRELLRRLRAGENPRIGMQAWH